MYHYFNNNEPPHFPPQNVWVSRYSHNKQGIISLNCIKLLVSGMEHNTGLDALAVVFVENVVVCFAVKSGKSEIARLP